MYDFFISHSSLDKELVVDGLVNRLEQKQFSVWYDKNNISYGDNINKEVQEGLKKSFTLILVVTHNFFQSKWVYFESGQYSIFQKAKIIPIIYDIATEEYLQLIQILGNIKYLNAKEKKIDTIILDLEEALKKAKQQNEALLTKDALYSLYKKLNSYENIQADIVCMKMKEYFDIMEQYPVYLIFSAKKILSAIACDIGKYFGINDSTASTDYAGQLAIINKVASINISEYFSYIYHLDGEQSNQDILLLIDKALVSIVRWYLAVKYSTLPNNHNFEIIYPGEMKHSDFLETDEIDYLVLREDLIASVETAIEWYDYNNYTYIAIRDRGSKKIVGYFTLLPITEDTYNLILSGDFMDKEFTTDSIVQYEAPGIYILYVASVAIHPQYQNTNAFLELYNAVIDVVISLAQQREIYFSQILAEASTKQGEKLCKIMGMKKHNSTTTNTDVYTLTLIPPELRLFGSKGKLLVNLCKQKYEEYRDYFDVPY
ncbi:MAG: toll/interleukin-1 receptor domain-containing protein [Lachnospiraceae bacterium]|nr:toll/interleukin-1 receptor domain-containing protein [Lachnospiraceae bacterium]